MQEAHQGNQTFGRQVCFRAHVQQEEDKHFPKFVTFLRVVNEQVLLVVLSFGLRFVEQIDGLVVEARVRAAVVGTLQNPELGLVLVLIWVDQIDQKR